jgi:hypothetical protein
MEQRREMDIEMLRPDDPRLDDPTLQELILRLRGLDVGQQEIEQAAYYRENCEAFLLKIRAQGDEMSRSPHCKRWLERKEKATKEEEEEESSICLGVLVDPLELADEEPRKSSYRGVSWKRKSRKWISQLTHKGKHEHLGSFATEVEAAIAYDKAAKPYGSSQHKPNFAPATPRTRKVSFLHSLPSELSSFLEMATRTQEEVYRSEQPLDRAPEGTCLEVDHPYVISGGGSTTVCATDLSRVGDVSRAQAVSSKPIVTVLGKGGQCKNYTPTPKEAVAGKLDVLPKVLLDFKSEGSFTQLCPRFQTIIRICRAVNDFCSGPRFPLKVHILLGEDDDGLILQWLDNKFVRGEATANARSPEDRMNKEGIQFSVAAPGDIEYHQDTEGGANIIGGGGRVNGKMSHDIQDKLNPDHPLFRAAPAQDIERGSASGERVVRTDSFLTIRAEPGSPDQNFEEREYISMNGIAKRVDPHSRDSASELLLPTVASVRHGVELHTGFLATNMSLTTFPLPVLTGHAGEFHGRSSVKTAKELLASQRYEDRILPAGRQPIGDGQKAPMVVSINITCFGRDEEKNHVLVGELLRNAMNCVA